MKAEARSVAASILISRWGTAQGQTWSIGRHAMIIGDARMIVPPDDCDTLVFDPPWNAAPTIPQRAWTSSLVFTSGRHIGDAVARFGSNIAWQFVWDCAACHARSNVPFQRYKACLWYGNIRDYRWRGARLDGTPDRPSGKKLSDLYVNSLARLHADEPHPHAKPLEWVRCLIGNCALGDVYDPFLGSGTTLLACEMTGRRCVGVEVEPAWAARTLDRSASVGLSVRRLT